MPRISIWGKLAAVGLVCYLAAAVFVGGDARAQKDDKEKDKGKEKDDKFEAGDLKRAYLGVESCRESRDGRGCHNFALDDPLPPDDRSLVCRCNEIKFWQERDKHSAAYRVLITEKADAESYVKNLKDRYTKKEWDAKKDKDTPEGILKKNERAIRMVTTLRKAKNDEKYKLTADPDCLACHAQVVTEDDKKKGFVTKSFNLEEGVTCSVCHGSYDNWIAGHALDSKNKFEKWRSLDRIKKEKDWGMTDLWNPVNRTRACASCHVGNKGGDGQHPRFVTHEMYAAGHPPLPSFEIAAFSNEMPRHWDYLRDKNDDILKYQKIDKKNFEYEQTQLVLIGAATALAESMGLIASQAGQVSDEKPLDWSNYDCYACHHGLEKDAWRQERGYGKNRPGRLPMRPWAAELIRLAIAYVGTDEAAAKKEQAAFDEKLDAVKLAFTKRMYGDAAEIKDKASELQKWAKKLADDVAKKLPTKKEDAVRAYQMIPKVYDAKTPKQWIDFDSARQVGWGFKVIYFDLKRYPWFDDEKKDKKDEKNSKKDDPVMVPLAELEKMLKLDLPKAPKTIEDDMEATMNALNKYRPADFNKKLEALGKSLPKE